MVNIDMVMKVTANRGGWLTPKDEDCTLTPITPGPCDYDACLHDCRTNIGPGTIGQCVSRGCQCAYCDFDPLRRISASLAT
jgi:hypothetical protein